MSANTVFILGAGASNPYGYPTGADLRVEIFKKYADAYVAMLAQNNPGFHDHAYISHIRQFASDFERSSIFSIDLFLSKNGRYEDTGKRAIAQRIHYAENNSHFREEMGKPKEDWYSYLFNQLNSPNPGKGSYKDFDTSSISFITFNYDRSLEYFLWDSFLHSYTEIKEPLLLDLIKKMKIWHVYGQIDFAPWQSQHFGYKEQECTPGTIDLMQQNIRVIHEDGRNDFVGREEAKNELIAAERIVFLGFGFAKENLDALDLPTILEVNKNNKRHIYATALGFTDREVTKIKTIFNNSFTTAAFDVDSPLFFAPQDWNCLDLLRQKIF